MADQPYGGRIRDIEDSETGIAVGEVGPGADHVNTARFARRVMVTHDRGRRWTGYVDHFQAHVPV